MQSRVPITLIVCFFVGILVCVGFADDLGFDGHKLVEPDCESMSHWFQCRDIDTAPPGVFLGYLYMHHTSATLGPDGNTVYPDTGEPYVTTVTACSSCHFTGGHVPFGSPVYQSPSKYQPNPDTGLGPYFRPLGYHRDLEDSIIDCFRNCMNAERAPEKDDPVMVALVEYTRWVSDGIMDPSMRDDWTLLPPEAGPKLPFIAGVSSMRADPIRGASLYANNCADCHDEDGPGAGEYRPGDIRPRIPALWGIVDGYSRGAAFYRTPVLAAYVQKHMPYDEPETLGDQDALDLAAFINAPDKPRPGGMADQMYGHNDPDGIPSALRKPADWLVGFEYPGEREYFEGRGIDFDDMVLNGPWDELAAWRAAEIDRLTRVRPVEINVTPGSIDRGGIPELLESDDQRVLLDPEFVRFRYQLAVTIDAVSPVLSPATLSFSLESRTMSHGGEVERRIELYNYVSGTFELLDLRRTSDSDRVVTLTPSGNLERFVEPETGAMQARIRYENAFPGWVFHMSNRFFPYKTQMDHVYWSVTP